MSAFDEGEKEMSKKAILFLVALLIIGFIAGHTMIVERHISMPFMFGDLVQYWMPFLVVGLLLRKRSN